MITQTLKEMLLKAGFDYIPLNQREAELYFKFINGRVAAVQVFQVESPYLIEGIERMNLDTYRMFYQRGFSTVDLLSVFVTSQSEYCKNLPPQVGAYWVVDKRDKRFLIYENQPVQFYGVQEMIQKILDQQPDNPYFDAKERAAFLKNRPICNYGIILINVLVFLIVGISGNTEDAGYMLMKGASYVPYVIERGEYYRLFTAMFLHFGIQHLLNNMLVLFILGDYLERATGKIKFLLIYLLGGLSASALSLALDFYQNSYSVSAGASGAIFAVIGALLYVVLINKGRLENVTARQLLVMIAFSLYYGFTSVNVDNMAHIGGLVSGIFLGVIVYRKKKKAGVRL